MSASTPPPVRLLSLDDLARKAGMSRTSVWTLRRRPDFPQPLQLGRSVRFVESEVDTWLMAQRIETATQAADDGETADGAAGA